MSTNSEPTGWNASEVKDPSARRVEEPPITPSANSAAFKKWQEDNAKARNENVAKRVKEWTGR